MLSPTEIFLNKKAEITKNSFGNSAIFFFEAPHHLVSSYYEDLGFSRKLLS